MIIPDYPTKQRTVARQATCSGIGVHSGKKAHVTIKPAAANRGIRFVRTDLPGTPVVSALFNQVVDTSLATVIGNDGCIISTIEHLMAALSALSIDNAMIEIDAHEMPIIDGSARPFFDLIETAGIEEQEAERCFFIIKEAIELRDGDKFVGAYPDASRKLTCTITYDHPLIKEQSITINLDANVFKEEIASARTFGFMHEVEMMKRFGLARGGSLDNAIVIGKEDILINNIAYLLRRFPMFAIPGDGSYRLQPVYVDDLAELAEPVVDLFLRGAAATTRNRATRPRRRAADRGE